MFYKTKKERFFNLSLNYKLANDYRKMVIVIMSTLPVKE